MFCQIQFELCTLCVNKNLLYVTLYFLLRCLSKEVTFTSGETFNQSQTFLTWHVVQHVYKRRERHTAIIPFSCTTRFLKSRNHERSSGRRCV